MKIVFAIMCMLLSSKSFTQCESYPEGKNLLSLYKMNGTNGNKWKHKQGWESAANGGNCDPCKGWYGVTCENSKVVGLNLYYNNLNGIEIPTQLANLKNLRWLVLARNTFQATDFKFATNLTQLRILDLSNCNINAQIPNNINNLKNLEVLFLRGNALKGSIPNTMWDLKKLRRVWLDNNRLTGKLPRDIDQLKNLAELSLYNNKLTGTIPPKIGRLKKLKILWLDTNKMTGSIPDEIGGANKLTWFDISKNNFSGKLPSSLADLKSVKKFYLAQNDFEGCFPIKLWKNISRYGQNENENDGTYFYSGDEVSVFTKNGYSFLGNPKLTLQGDFKKFTENNRFYSLEDQNNLPCGKDSVIIDCNCVSSFCNLDFSLEIQNGTCGDMGGLSGIISQGTPPYVVEWDTGTKNQNDIYFNIPNLDSGTYSITVTDGKGCSKIHQSTIINTKNVDFTLDIPNNQCDGAAVINISISGGKAPFNVNYSGPLSDNIVSNTSNISLKSLIQGNYNIKITDANNCLAEKQASINTVAIDVSVQKTENSITLTPSGGSIPYFYHWSNGKTQNAIYNLVQGQYSCTITDSNGCSTTIIESISGVMSCQLVVNLNMLQAINCFGDKTGKIKAEPLNGKTPFSYIWNNNMKGQIISDLGKGRYTVTVTDQDNCTATESFELTQPPILKVTSNIQNENNGQKDGKINLTVSGGKSPYRFLWNTNETTTSISQLTADEYFCTITDDNGCTIVNSFVVSGDSGNCNNFEISLMGQDVSCFGMKNGRAGVETINGMSPFNYKWNNGKNTKTVDGLGVGTYSVIVTDAMDCEQIGYVTINQPNELSVSIDNIVAETGLNLNDGSIQISINGGVSPYNFLWNSGQTVANISNLSPSVYYCTITDDNGCEIVSEPILIQKFIEEVDCESEINLQIVTTPSTITCLMPNTKIAVDSETADKYSWTTSSGGFISTTNNKSVIVNKSGIYTVTLLDVDKNCEISKEFVVEENLESPSITIPLTFDYDCDQDAVKVNIDVQNAINSSFEWQHDATLNSSQIFIQNGGSYFVTVTNQENGCTESANFDVLDFVLQEKNNIHTCDSEIELEGLFPYQLNDISGKWTSLDENIEFNSVDQFKTNISISNTGIYDLLWVISNDECSIDTTKFHVMYQNPEFELIDDSIFIDLNAIKSPNQFNVLENDDLIHLSDKTVSAVLKYPSFLLNSNGWLYYDKDLTSGDYQFDYFVTDNICKNMQSATVFIHSFFGIEKEFPVTVITPNNDGLNDKLNIYEADEYIKVEVTIFNRWGSIVNYFPHYDNEIIYFDGNNQMGQHLSDGTYYYVANKYRNGKLFYEKGTVIVRR